MRLEQMEYLISLAETGSITQTAKYFFMSQQGISYSIQQLEKELDVKILHNHRNRVTFTAAGECVLVRARDFVKQYQELQEELQSFQKDKTPSYKARLFLYIDPFMANTFLPRILKKLHKQSKIKLATKEQNLTLLLQTLSDPSEVDGIGLVGLTEHYTTEQFKQKFDFEPIHSCHLQVLVSETSPLAKLPALSFEEIAQYPICLFASDYNSEEVGKDLFFGRTVKNLSVILQTTNVDMYRDMVNKNIAIGLTTDYLESFFHKSSLTGIPLKEPIQFHVGFIRRKGRPFSVMDEEFMAIAKDVLNSQLAKKVSQ
ncbi:LysR family transcriptional regulator [Desulfitobacterium hafniense]|uniref:HTH lysR-type domain-containing protein n=4 Tax=root TaxID=1 RepID=Q251H5_DESHY|nr:LysR family transcriptional regulator [Desulfitobacterium hafniense]ACL18293.1 transcriptional regulator, LysR family [Desulfitobacterium hafniense DCB-2]KTE92348.1 LysR family transcriptional regulator [Desulfitobacterium hafniense]MEA5024432.1 LysR family transcriptional regulator [Desulfitobacterium hafniense]BAE82067.1 hypothetical protein DSY0278 [Desulfitobacterium hafniense Y51]